MTCSITKSYVVLIYFNDSNSLVLVFLFDMVNTILFKLLPKHISADYFKLNLLQETYREQHPVSLL